MTDTGLPWLDSSPKTKPAAAVIQTADLDAIARYSDERGWRLIWMVDYYHDGKPLPLKGTTGYKGVNLPRPADAVTLSIGCPVGAAMLDVDHYIKEGRQKVGADKLREMEARLGPLPPTWKITCRGAGDQGGKMPFLVPADARLRDPDPDIEALQWFWRFTWAPGTLHPQHGSRVEVFRDGVLCDLPYVAELPQMPSAWVEDLQHKRPRGECRDVEVLDDGHTVCAKARLWLNRVKVDPGFAGTDPRGHRANNAVNTLKNLANEGHYIKAIMDEVRELLYSTDAEDWWGMWDGAPVHQNYLDPDRPCCGISMFGELISLTTASESGRENTATANGNEFSDLMKLAANSSTNAVERS